MEIAIARFYFEILFLFLFFFKSYGVNKITSKVWSVNYEIKFEKTFCLKFNWNDGQKATWIVGYFTCYQHFFLGSD